MTARSFHKRIAAFIREGAFAVAILLITLYVFSTLKKENTVLNNVMKQKNVHSKNNITFIQVSNESRNYSTPMRKRRNPAIPSKKYVPDPSVNDFCVSWDINMDVWWTHNPEWQQSSENNTHYCFKRIQNARKAEYLRRLYDIQFNGNCSEVTTREMWSSGWNADFSSVTEALGYALDVSKKPVQMHVRRGAWHYAGKKDASRAVCKRKNMFCYFLQISSCRPIRTQLINSYQSGKYAAKYEITQTEGLWLQEYATRPQTWLRKEVYKYSTSIQIATPCTVIHVRRADVILHDDASRRYYPISDYIEAAGDQITRNIFLLTDDQNAIDEALYEYPEYNWQYLNRTRHRGAEGGWEDQIPSDDPKQEVIVILSTFRLVRSCGLFIHSTSGFSNHLFRMMNQATSINLDSEKDYDEIENPENSKTANISRTYPKPQN